MILTVFELNHKDKRTIRSVTNRNEMHRDIQALFGDDRQAGRNVYRIVERNNSLMLYVYSEKSVNYANMHFGMKYLGEGIVPMRHAGDEIQIDMLVTPIKTMTCHDGKRRKRPIFDKDARLDWCRRKALENGFEVCNIVEAKKETLSVDKHNGSPWILDAYDYKLQARVIDEEKFSECLINGLGRNGAYGAGMLILA